MKMSYLAVSGKFCGSSSDTEYSLFMLVIGNVSRRGSRLVRWSFSRCLSMKCA